VEMLTIKECLQVSKGVTESTLRKLVALEKIPYKRAGEGKRGKILIKKSDLLAHFD